MIKVKENQISLNDVIYYTGNYYDAKHELKKIVVKSLELDKNCIIINNNYMLYKNEKEGYYYSCNLYFSEKKANNVVNDYIKQENKRKEKYKKEQEIKERNKNKIIDDKLSSKYIDKPIMIYRGEDGWVKTKGKEVFATESGIYIRPYFDGHICKLSREGSTWKMWSELEELEEKKKELEKRIQELKEGEDNGK